MHAPATVDPSPSRTAPEPARPLRIAAATLSLSAGAIHLLAAPEHLEEWWGYGSFFLTAAVAQGLFGLLLLGQPWRYDERGVYHPSRNAPLVRRLLWAAIVLTAAVIALYVLTRTAGIPLLGPSAGEVEAVDGAGLAATTLEAAQVACLLALLRREP